MRKFIKIIIGSIFICIAYIFTAPLALWVIGYYPDGVGWKVAQEIVRNKGSVSDCKKIIHTISHPFSPTAGEQRSSCIYDYAKLTKDPSACALLMPSSYGLSCVGGAESQPDICSMDTEGVAWWQAEDVVGKATYESCRVNDPNRSRLGNQCCLLAKVAFVKSENDCSTLEDYPEMHDECLQSLAFKNHAPATCGGIHNENTKSACIVNAEAIRKNPSICEGCKTRVETLDQLR